MAKTRRTRGTGCFDRCGEYYRWRIGVYDPLTGKTRYKSIKAKTRRDLEAKVAAWKEENGGDVPPVAGKRLKVSRWVELWLVGCENKIAQSTLLRYRINAERHILPRFGSMYMQKVSPLDLQIYFDELSKTHTPSTVATIRGHFRVCFGKAVKYGLISRNPVIMTDPPKCQKSDLRILDEDEVSRLLMVAKDCSYRSAARDDSDAYIMRRNYYIVLLAVASGMRQGEILGLKWDCVHGQEIEVKFSLQNLPNEKRVLKSPKNGKPRTVYIPASVAAALDDWRKYQDEYAEKYKGIYNDSLNLVFTGHLGSCIDGGRLTVRHFRAMCAAAGLPGLRFHDLRHYWGSSALSRGVSIMAVSEQLGHSSIDITLRRYTHVLKRSKDELKAMLDENPLFSSL